MTEKFRFPYKNRLNSEEFARREEAKQRIPTLFNLGISERDIAVRLHLPITLVENYISIHRLREEKLAKRKDGEARRPAGEVERLVEKWKHKIKELRDMGWTNPMISEEIHLDLTITNDIIQRLLDKEFLSSNRRRKYPQGMRKRRAK